MSSLDFRPEVLEAQKTSIWGTVLVKPHAFYERAFQAIVLITLLFFALLFLGHYSTKETVKGIIEPKEGLVSLYAQQSGYIENLYAQQGESVRLQEKILSISDHQQLEQGQEYVDVLKKQLNDDQERVLQRAAQLKNEYDLKRSEEQVKSDQRLMTLSTLEKQYPLQCKMVAALQKQYNRLQELYEKGSIPKVHVEKAETEWNAASKELIALENSIDQLKMQIQNEHLAITQLQHDFDEKKLIIEQQLAEVKKKLVEVERASTSYVHAPFSGVVTQLYLKPGQFVRSGQHIADLLKQDDCFIAKLYVPSKAIGLIKKGQRVSMRIHAYPHEHFGTLLGKVEHITDSLYQGGEYGAQEPLYLVYVALDQQSMKADGRFALKQGLVLDADIKTQELTIMQKILEPLYRMAQ